MKTLELKANAHQLIDGIQDSKILKTIITFIARAKGEPKEEFWNQLSDEQRVAIEEGLAQLKRGEGVPHEKVMQEVKTKFKLS